MPDNKIWTGASNGAYSTAGNWSPSGVPAATDHVRFTAGSSVDVTSGLNQSAVAIGDFIVEDGNSSDIGTFTNGIPTYLQIDPDKFEFAGRGTCFIDIGTAAIDCRISNAARAGSGLRGLYLIGSAIDDLIVSGGDVGVATIHGATATVATAHCTGGSLWLGAGTTLTTLRANGGEVVLRCAATTVNQFAGVVRTEEVGAITTYNMYGGTCILNSVGTITTLNIYGGTVILTDSNKPRTITTTTISPKATSVLSFDSGVITMTNKPTYSVPVRLSVSAL